MLTTPQRWVLERMRVESPDACYSEEHPGRVAVGNKVVQRQTMDALERRGLIRVYVPVPWADDPDPIYIITDAGLAALGEEPTDAD